MKISTERGIEMLCEITPYVADIVNDSEIRGIVDKHKTQTSGKKIDKTTEIKYFSELLTPILKRYKEPIYIVLAAVYETTPDEIAKQPFPKTLSEIKEIANDTEMMSFFTSLTARA